MLEINLAEQVSGVKEEFDKLFIYRRLLGSGAFGKVIQAVDRETEEEVAVKVINKAKYTAKHLNKLQKEIEILQSISHSNIVEFRRYVERQNYVFIVMEFVRGGTLNEFMLSRRSAVYLTETEIATLVKHILKAVNHLHKHEIIHRDIKLDNILIDDRDDLSSVKLCDFGLSSQVLEFGKQTDYSGTITYMAPEQLDKRHYSKTVDLWSCGVVLYILLSRGVHPFVSKGDRTKHVIRKIKGSKPKFDFKCSELVFKQHGQTFGDEFVKRESEFEVHC